MKTLLNLLTILAMAATLASATFAEQAAAEKPAEKAKTVKFTGRIAAIDTAAGTVTVKQDEGDKPVTKSFTTDAKTKVMTSAGSEAFSDLKTDDFVLVIADDTGRAQKIQCADCGFPE
jgi:Cu/Ag efflux protein CusF